MTDFLSSVGERDLLIRARDVSGVAFASDDNSSPLGDGTAPALLGFGVNADGSVRIDITEASDPLFAGDHNLFSVFDGTLTVRDGEQPDAQTLAEESFREFIQPGVVTDLQFGDPAWIGGVFDLVIDNFPVGFGSDVDFFRFTGLPAGSVYSASVTATGDPAFLLSEARLAAFTAPSVQDASTQGFDPGAAALALLGGFVPPSGELVLAVSAPTDGGFTGVHTAEGQYTLALELDSPLAADYDRDLDVDGNDFVAWAGQYGTTGAALPADGNGDGRVDAIDYTIWRDALPELAFSVTTPEPSSALLAATACLLGIARRSSHNRGRLLAG